jgi:hypothetical protein
MAMQLLLLVEYNDYTYQVIKCNSTDGAAKHIERLKKDSTVASLELIDAQTLMIWDNPAAFESWIDETEL